jgi:ubiquinone/menaquinone biosynthesis C-methylase UbiE
MSVGVGLEHYHRDSVERDLDAMLAAAFPDDLRLTPADLAPLDQFHSRGILATAELAERAGIDRSTRVLDVGSGLGGPARFLAATYGCHVTGIDLSPSFVAAARALTERTALTDLVSFEAGDAVRLPFPDASFDCVTLHHVAMNIADRAGLYAGIRRVLAPGGRFVTYDVVRDAGDLLFPVPWARDESASFLISAEETRSAIESPGFNITSWTDETAIAIEWFTKAASAPPPPGALSFARLIAPEFASMSANFRRNLAEGRAAIVAVVAERV